MTPATCTAAKRDKRSRRWTVRLLSSALTAALLLALLPSAFAGGTAPLTVEWIGHRIDGDTAVITATAHLYDEGEPVATDAQVAEYRASLVAYERPQGSDDLFALGAEVDRVPMTTSTASITLSGPGSYTIVLECGGWEVEGYGTWGSSIPYYGRYDLEPEDWESSSWDWESGTWSGDAREAFLELIADLASLSGQALLDAVIQEYNDSPGGSRLWTLAYDIIPALQDMGQFEEVKVWEGGRYAPLLDYAWGWSTWELSPQEMARTLPGTQAMNVSVLEGELDYLGLTGLTGAALAQAVAAEDAKVLTLRPGDELAGILTMAQEELACYGSDFMAYLKGLDGGKYAALVDYLAPKVQAELANGGAGEEFPDVTGEEWFAEYAYYAKDSGLFSGKDGGRFAPNDQLTIAEALTLAARLYSTQTDIAIPAGAGAWYQPYVDFLKAQGLPWQYADYGAVIDRTEFAHIFASVVDGIDQSWGGYYLVDVLALRNEVPDGSIPDLPMSAPYAGEIYQLYRLGILTGSDAAHSFRGSSNITRSEVATILCRMLGMGLQEIYMA